MTGTDVATVAPSTGTLTIEAGQSEWTTVQRAALAHIGIAEAPPADQQVFLHVCQRVGLDPFAKQIYMIKRTEKGKDKWTIQTGIDGFRLVAEDNPQYAGTLDPQWCGPDGKWRDVWTEKLPPVAARVVVLRHDRAHPICLPVRFSEFAATFADGNLQGQWRTKPTHMIAKCAEAASLRKAFPRQLSGVFTDDEMSQTDHTPTHGRGVVDHDAAPVTASELINAAAPAPKRETAAEEQAQPERPTEPALQPAADDVMDAEIVEDAPAESTPPVVPAQNGNPGTPSKAVDAAMRFVRLSAERKGIAWDDARTEYAKRYEGEVIEDATDQNRLTAFAKLLIPVEVPA